MRMQSCLDWLGFVKYGIATRRRPAGDERAAGGGALGKARILEKPERARPTVGGAGSRGEYFPKYK